MRLIASSGWSWAPTTMCRGRSIRVNFSPASRRCCGGTTARPRRATALPRRRSRARPETTRLDRWTVDFGRRELLGDDGVAVPLSTAEFRLLCAFLDHPGVILTREQLLDLTVGRAAASFDRSID